MKKRYQFQDLALTKQEAQLLRSLRTPEQIQRFISEELIQNFEEFGATTMSVRRVLATRKAHCIEAAFVAACALWAGGEKPLLLDFRAEHDDDHVLAIFKSNGCWGAISKSNHSVVRYRDPIYRTLRELSMSYLHEYYNAKGEKTLRSYSLPLDLSNIDPEHWVTGGDECWEVGSLLEDRVHYPLITSTQAKRLARLDSMEKQSAALLAYKKVRNKK